MKIAALNTPLRGTVWDYVATGTAATNYVFQGDSTYYISSPFLLRGTTVLEGGAVLKLPVSTTAGIQTTNLVCKTQPFHPAVITASTDSSLGECVAGGSPTPPRSCATSWPGTSTNCPTSPAARSPPST